MAAPFYPTGEVRSSDRIPYERLAEAGVRGILFDIDNTLVPHGNEATPEAVELFERIRAAGLKTCLISNNHRPRVEPFADAVGSPYLFDAHKPSPAGYRRACEIMGVKISECVFVGDQIFTDIWGANLAGMHSILVQPIHPKEEIQIVLKRIPERLVLYFYRRKRRKRRHPQNIVEKRPGMM